MQIHRNHFEAIEMKSSCHQFEFFDDTLTTYFKIIQPQKPDTKSHQAIILYDLMKQTVSAKMQETCLRNAAGFRHP